jgi:gliding motility-associated-like protein
MRKMNIINKLKKNHLPTCYLLIGDSILGGLISRLFSRNFCILLLFAFPLISSATHLVGGDITYRCLGNDDYEITLTVFRDCGPNSMAPFDNTGVITVYYGDNSYINYYNAQRSPIVRLPNTVNNPCLQVPPNVCTEKAEYTIVLKLPPDPRGYTILHQRCCRNNTINNIPAPGTWGNTYYVEIPPNDSCNSSPAYNFDPPVALCMMDTLVHDFSVTEIDGDSVYYELCVPLHGGGNNTNTTNNFLTPLPIPGAAPPYTAVPFLPAFNLGNPMPANPVIAVDPATGIMTGMPTAIGQYVFAVCATEYRNGIALSTIRRDFQFNVVACNSNVTAVITSQDPTQACQGRTVQFFENSINASTFEWNFGDPASGANNTATAQNPVHTFSDTGRYTITLIANPGYACADTTTIVYNIRDPLDPSFVYTGNPCIDRQDWRFVLQFPDRVDHTANFQWDFGPDATPRIMTTPVATGMTFNRSGIHSVFLRVQYEGCEETYAMNVEIFDRPQFDVEPGPLSGCVPFTFEPKDLSNANTAIEYSWDFGNGRLFNIAEPSFTFSNPGTKPVSLIVRTRDGCEDSAAFFFELNLFRSPEAQFTISPERVSYYEARVDVKNIGAQPEDDVVTDMGDGNVYRLREFSHDYRDTGWFEVTQSVITPEGCINAAVKEVYVAPEVLLFIPNTFTPNGDGVNDIFSWSATGMRTFDMIIFSRWGDEIYRTDDPSEYWNGRYQNKGDIMPEGVYTWVVYAWGIDDRAYRRTGTVLLSK